MKKNGNLQKLFNLVSEIWNGEKKAPLKVSVMGQTGVGKSSLINALFNTKLDTDPIRPMTSKIQEVPVEGGISGHILLFYDLPGIGESDQADEEYLRYYKDKLLESDVVIWAINADSRSYKFDRDALQKSLEIIEKDRQPQLMNKILFVLTKADLLTPSPWILQKIGDEGLFAPQDATKMLLEQKELYFQKAFILPFKDILTSQTYYTGNFNVTNPHFRYNKREKTVYYDGFLDKESSLSFKNLYPPEYAEVFDRLYNNYRVIPCSSQFRFNLNLLMRVITAKLETSSVGRFGEFLPRGIMDRVPFTDAKNYHNLIVLNENRTTVYDLSKFDI